MTKFHCKDFSASLPFEKDFDYAVIIGMCLPVGLYSVQGEVAVSPDGFPIAFTVEDSDSILGKDAISDSGWCTWITEGSRVLEGLNVSGERDGIPFQIDLKGGGALSYGFNLEHTEQYPCFGDAVKANIGHLDAEDYRLQPGESYE